MPSAVVVSEGMDWVEARVHPTAAAVIEALRTPTVEYPHGLPICVCCEYTEHDRDKNGNLWLQFDIDNTRHKCRRCGTDCINRRCDELPTNPDGRGYGKLPIGRRGQ